MTFLSSARQHALPHALKELFVFLVCALVPMAAHALPPAAATNVKSFTTRVDPGTPGAFVYWQVSWDDNAHDEAGYVVKGRYFSGSRAVSPFIEFSRESANTTSTIISLGDVFGQLPNLSMQFQVIAYKNNGSKVETSTATTPVKTLLLGTNTFAAPSNLLVSKIPGNDGQYEVEFTDNATTEIWHRLGFKPAADASFNTNNEFQVSLFGENKVRTTLSLTPGTNYQFRVRAQSFSSFTPYSNIIELSTDPLTPPSGLQVVALDGTRVKLSWKDNSTNTMGYEMQYRFDTDSDFQPLTGTSGILYTGGDDTEFVVTVGPGTTSEWRVRGVFQDSTGGLHYSGFTSIAGASTPAYLKTPTNVEVVPAGLSGSIAVRWNNNDGLTTTNRVMGRTAGGTDEFSILAELPASAQEVLIKDLAVDEQIEVAVVSLATAGTSFLSTPVLVTPKDGFNPSLYVANLDSGQFGTVLLTPLNSEGAAALEVKAGVAFNHSLSVTNDGNRISWAVSGLPGGFNPFENILGVVSGTPVTSGVVQSPASVSYSGGHTAQAKLVFRVQQPPTSPEIAQLIPPPIIGVGGPLAVSLTGAFKDSDTPRAALLSTTLGDIKISLFEQVTPQAVANFLSYVNGGDYNGVSFHRAFPSGTGPNNSVNAVAVSPGGNALVAGNFTAYNGIPYTRLVLLRNDGVPNTAFSAGAGPNATVECLAFDSNGRILIGGSFTSYAGSTVGRLARLESDGSLDTGFGAGVGADETVKAIALQDDDKILIVGDFQNYDGVPSTRLARLESDGTLDVSFNTGAGANGQVTSVLALTGGGILIAGNFTEFDGTPRGGIAKLLANGSLDYDFDPGTGASGVVNALATLSDGKILVAGDFESFDGVSAGRIARLGSDGSLDATFIAGAGANAAIFSMVMLPGDKPLIAGNFTQFDGQASGRLARLSASGSYDGSFNSGTGANGIVRALAVEPGGKILVGGDFSQFNGLAKARISRLTSTGASDTGFNAGFVVQGGAFKPSVAPNKFSSTAKRPSPRNEPGVGNYRGIIAAAKVGGDPNSATHDFFLNLGDNSGNLDLQNSGFTAFGRIVGSGLNVMDAISSLPTGSYSVIVDNQAAASYSNWPMNQVPAPATMDITQTVNILSATEIPALTYAVTANNSPGVVTAAVINGQLSLTGVSEGSADITVAATDLDGNSVSQTVTVQVAIGQQAIAIQTQPATPGSLVVPGSNVTFTVVATGTTPSFQWRKNGVAIPGQTLNFLQLTSVTTANNGSYDVVVGNASNTVVSQPAILGVSQGALITSNPAPRMLRTGEDLILSVGVVGSPAPNVTWTKNNQAHSATGPLLSKTSATLADAGLYRATVQNDSGSQQSTPAAVVVVDAAARNFIVKSGSSLSLTVSTAQPSGVALSYQWKNKTGANVLDGGRFSGATRAKLTFSGVSILDIGEYSCLVTGPMGSALSGTFDVIVASTPVLPEFSLPDAFVAQAYEFIVPVDPLLKASAPTKFSAANLPPGLKIDAVTGRIYGIPTRRGNNSVTLRAFNPQGSVTKVLTLQVIPMPTHSTGVFAGLLARHELVNQSCGGRLDLSITDTGAYTGSVAVPGKTHRIRGLVTRSVTTIFSVSTTIMTGSAVLKQTGQPDRVLTFVVNASSATLSGDLAVNADNKSGLTGWKQIWDSKYVPTSSATARFDGTYHFGMNIPTTSVGDATIPQGSGYAALTVSTSGIAKVSGKTIDGKTVLCSAPLGPAGSFMVFQLLYNQTGSLLGPLAIAKRDGDLINGVSHSAVVRVNGFSFDHFKKMVPSARDYPGGFAPVSLSVIGGNYPKPPLSARNAITRLSADGQKDLLFNQELLTDNAILKLARQADGKLLVAGVFSRFGGASRNGIARLTEDGVLDPTFDPGTGANGAVFDVAVQADGKILVAGAFTQINGVTRNRVVRLNDDGTVDTGFDPGTGPNSTVESIALQADGKIVIGGQFGALNGESRSGIARLNSNGTVDSTFNANGTGTDGVVRRVVVQADQKILLGGDFSTYSQLGATFTRSRIARLNSDGTMDTLFNPGTGANSTVRAIAVQTDGKILIGGSFTTVNGQSRGGLARLTGTGVVDSGFSVGTGLNADVFAIALLPGDKIAAGGNFSTFNTSNNRNGVVVVNSVGGIDSAFNPPAGNAEKNENNSVRSLLEQGGKLVVGGWVRVRDSGLKRIMWLTDAKNDVAVTFTEAGLATAVLNPNVVFSLSEKSTGTAQAPNEGLTTWSYNASTGLVSGVFKPDDSGVRRTAKFTALLIPTTPSDIEGMGSFDLGDKLNGTTITSSNALIHTGKVKIGPKP